VVIHKSKILARRVSPQQKKDPQKRKRNKKEQGTKGKEVKPHLLIQGHDKLHKKREDENLSQVGETF
jgi:hypothetical protein